MIVQVLVGYYYLIKFQLIWQNIQHLLVFYNDTLREIWIIRLLGYLVFILIIDTSNRVL